MKKIMLSVIFREILRSKLRKRRFGGRSVLWLVGLAAAGTTLCAMLAIWITVSAIGHTVDFARTRVAIPDPVQLAPAALDSLTKRPLVPPGCPEFLASLVQTPRLLTSPLQEAWNEAKQRCRSPGEPADNGKG